MKNIFRGLFLALMILSLPVSQSLLARQNSSPADSLNFLRQYNGKYALEAKLFNNTIVRKRLEKLLGNQYHFLTKSTWQVETPVRVEKDFFYAWAMQTHSGGDPSATLLADLHKNIFYVEIVKGGHTTTYAEDGSKTVPEALKEWAKKQVAK
jgi:hypothetical protein